SLFNQLPDARTNRVEAEISATAKMKNDSFVAQSPRHYVRGDNDFVDYFHRSFSQLENLNGSHTRDERNPMATLLTSGNIRASIESRPEVDADGEIENCRPLPTSCALTSIGIHCVALASNVFTPSPAYATVTLP